MTEFYRAKDTKDGFQRTCKKCKREYLSRNRERARSRGRERYRENREKHIAHSRKYRTRNLEKVRAKARKWAREMRVRSDPKELHLKERDWSLRKHYGFTRAEFDAKVTEQGGVCAVCRRPQTEKTKNGYLCVDHKHGTMPVRVRGLLCHPCNRALGCVGDSIERLLALVDYLRLHGEVG